LSGHRAIPCASILRPYRAKFNISHFPGLHPGLIYFALSGLFEMKKIVLISLFFYEKTDNIRISTVYNLLKERGIEVELITTDFNHRNKTKHTNTAADSDITYLKVPTYKGNLSIGRLYSHFIFAIRLYLYLRKLSYTPSKLYCIVPTISSGLVCNWYCKKRGVPFFIDIIDLWPESLIILSKYRKLLSVLTYPWKLAAIKVYRSADEIFAGSVDYAEYALLYNKSKKAIPVYLGTDRERFKLLVAQSDLKIEKPVEDIWISYGGLLGNNYDFDVILDSFKRLIDEVKNIKLLFIGGGKEYDRILDYKDKFNLPIEVTGYLKYEDYLKWLSYSDIAINSFKKGTRVAYSYKFNDYISAGLPIVNNVNGETAELISRYKIGLNFNYADAPLYDKLSFLLKHPEMLAEMKKNSVFVAEQVLAKEIVYQEMMDKFIE